MIIQTLVYTNTDLYTYNSMNLVHQYSEAGSIDGLYDDTYINSYRHKFHQKRYSELHIVRLSLDPFSGNTEIIINEYANIPLKVRTEINAIAKNASFGKSKALAQALIDFDEVPEDEHEEDEAE